MKTKKIKLSFKPTQEQKEEIAKKLLASRRLFFILFWGILLIYFFNIVYKKAYIELNFVQYTVDTSFMRTHQESVTLEKIMKNIEVRKQNVENGKEKKYKDPFSSGKDDANAKSSDAGSNQNAVKVGTPSGY